MEILTVKDLSFTYPQTAQPALRSVSFSLQEGEFAVLCGATGSGKSTLLRLLKEELAPLGTRQGSITLAPRRGSFGGGIGFVAQRPEEQIVTDKVYAELAFGPESAGLPQAVMARRVAEMAAYFGIEGWFERDVATLSGGQKQLLNLASVMVMEPQLLLLDEPTSQLDPIAAADFVNTLKKLNRDLSLTVLVIEHRLEELIPLCDRLLVMKEGRLVQNGPPRRVLQQLALGDELLAAMPAPARLYHAVGADGPCPLTIREGREMLEKKRGSTPISLPVRPYAHSGKEALVCRDVYFRYGKTMSDVLRGLDLTVYENEIFCLLGGNGSGKSTALACIAGLLRIYSGKITIFGKRQKDYHGQSLYQNCLALLPQDVQHVFLRATVREELADVGAEKASLPFSLSHLMGQHPYDLSGGEQQLLALGKVLATAPRLLLMDEPTKGLDAARKTALVQVLKGLKAKGVTLLIVTHDVEFAAQCADRCGLFFRGALTSVGTPQEFFSQNSFYTTAASRMGRGYMENAVTVEELAEAWGEEGAACSS